MFTSWKFIVRHCQKRGKARYIFHFHFAHPYNLLVINIVGWLFEKADYIFFIVIVEANIIKVIWVGIC